MKAKSVDPRSVITAARSREIASELARRGARVPARVVRRWPRGRLRDAILWMRVWDATFQPPGAIDLMELGHFLDSRERLRRCEVCGCTEDNPCADPGKGYPCSWVGPSLCSGCVRD